MEYEKILVKGKITIGMKYDETDFKKMKKVYLNWKKLNEMLIKLGSRAMNIPDLLSEGLFAYLFKVYRTNGSSHSMSYDAYDVENNIGIQIKSCSIDNDCTSFGPMTHWDKIFFMKFYPKSDDGLVEIYDISNYDLNNIIMNAKKNETFKDQQNQGRRPRFSIQKEIIKKYNVKPIKVIRLLEDFYDEEN